MRGQIIRPGSLSLSVPLTGEERAEAVVGDIEELVLVAAHDGHGGGVGGGDDILELLSGEDVGGGEVGLGVAVLSGLGGGHVHHLRFAVSGVFFGSFVPLDAAWHGVEWLRLVVYEISRRNAAAVADGRGLQEEQLRISFAVHVEAKLISHTLRVKSKSSTVACATGKIVLR